MTEEPDFKTITQKLRDIGEGEALPPIKVPSSRRHPGPQQGQEPGAGTHAHGSEGE